ncbi:MAG: cytochrome P450 [Albidovulum sp.]|nr:cytochrome P450 [Albidovulum sp.]
MTATKKQREPAKVPLATGRMSVFGLLRIARRNVLETIPELATWQTMVSGKIFKRWHMVMDPGGLRRILKERPEAYPKSEAVKNLFKPVIGNSLFVAEGKHWQWQRRAAAPAFAARNLKELAPVMSGSAARMVERLQSAVGNVADLHLLAVAATFEVINSVCFSGEDSMELETVQDAFEKFIEDAGRVSLLDVASVPAWVPRPGRLYNSYFHRRELKRITDPAIEMRRSIGPRTPPDLLDLLAEGEDPQTKRRMNNDELRDNLITFILAGHETTALSLAWSLYLLAFDPSWQRQVRVEAQSVLNGRIATAEDVSKLVLTRQVIEEALRLYPPSAMLARTARERDTVGGRQVLPGDTLFIPIYALHRNHCFWSDPDRFNPGRFADRSSIDKFAFLPFGGGMRICIGASFALMEAVIILSSVVSKYKFALLPGQEPEPVMILTLRPKGGVLLKVEAA